ncbi:unnamed protein product [Arabis nemorensis]|uniref:SHSP domain-containing protein n=1 Tax=Arabis nemorensis TaxID=586526 RepID=A0A565BIZ4_9BRAS|nr:unnamed protein product [Arabis nemorensis]
MEIKLDHATANRIYDDFEPISNWKTEQGFESLTVYLPGFRKEQLKVQVTTTRKLRVMGERPTGPNKWIRFRKEFPIRSNIDVDSIAAKFEGTNLVVKLHIPEPLGKQTSPSGTTTKPPIVPKETEKVQSPKPERENEAELEKAQLQKPTSEEDAKKDGKEEGLKGAEKKKDCDGILNQDYRYKVNAYKENLGGYVALMKNNTTAITAGMVAPAAAVLLLSLGFYAGRVFTSYN